MEEKKPGNNYKRPAKSTSGLEDSPHPKFQHDERNSGQSQYKGPQTSAVKWKSTAFGISHETSPIIGSDGTIYIQSFDGSTTREPFSLFALNPDGSVKWSYVTAVEPSTTPALGSDGTIYFGSFDYNVYAIAPDGGKKWSYTTGGVVTSSPAIGSDGTIYIAGEDNYLYALNPNGTLKWKYLVGEPVYSSPAVGSDGTIYIISENINICAFNPDGTLKWSHNFNFEHFTNPAIGPDGTLYIIIDCLYAFNTNGTQKWQYGSTESLDKLSGVGSDGTIYITGVDQISYYMDAVTPNGQLKWKYRDGSAPFGYSTFGSDGTIYFGSMGGYVYALKPNGMLKWKYNKGGGIVNASPVIGSDGTLYVANANVTGLYAFADRLISAHPPGGQYRQRIVVKLKMNQRGTIYWRYHNPLRPIRWQKYTSPIRIDHTKTLEFYGENLDGDKSVIYSEKYIII